MLYYILRSQGESVTILLTNDDGVNAPGLAALYESLAPRHDVTVAAPSVNRSGASQSITVGRALTARPAGAGRWAVDGTPADCVRLGFRSLCPESVDLVIAGINHGANLGTDILLSGTVGAARQAALMGGRALAVSCVNYASPEDARFAADFIAENIEALASILERGQFLNINAPACPGPLAVARPGNIQYAMQTNCLESDDSARFILFSSRPLPPTEDDGDDWRMACQGAVVLSAFGLWGPDEGLERRLRALLPALSLQAGEFRAEIGAGPVLQQAVPRLQEE